MTTVTSDLSRNVICILGVPLDSVTTEQALQAVRAAVRTRQRLFLSTPNLFFLIRCQGDRTFRQSVIDSDLSVADGMPLVWMSRWLGASLPERVTGAGLFQRLIDEPVPPGHSPIKVYFFGGPPGVAEAAGRNLNSSAGGIVCVGHASPGFGSVEALSAAELLKHIDASGADFLVVALGAAKGQAWIQRNQAHLQVPVISHLGAVVNFTARTVSRAPVWMQNIGLEWLWRVKEEPTLWCRYGSDALALAGLFFGKLLLYRLWLSKRWTTEDRRLTVVREDDPRTCRLRIIGLIPDPVPSQIRTVLRQTCDQGKSVDLDLKQVVSFGPSFAGLLLLLNKTLRAKEQRLYIGPLPAQIRRLFDWNGLNSLLDPDGCEPPRC